MKQLSSMMTGSGLQRLQHAADADAAGEMHVLADLRAGADRRPGVHHRAFADIGAEVHEARHQHDVRRDIGRAAHDRAGHGAEARGAEAVLAPAVELRRHLVPPVRAAGGARDRAHVVEAEREQHGLLEPLVDLPLAVALLLGDARFALVEQFECGVDRLAHRAFGGRAHVVALLEGVVDDLGKVGHWRNPVQKASRFVGAGRGMSRPQRAAEEAGEIIGHVIHMGASRPSISQASRTTSREPSGTTSTVVMPSVCGTSRLRAKSSNIAARAGSTPWALRNRS